ncbi:MAG: immunity repressor protein, partial [Sporolactobacillus sp.]
PIEFNTNKASFNEKDEKDVAKRLEKVKKDLENAEDGDGYMLLGEPISEEAKQSIIEAMEFAIRQSKRINKKYTPKKYRKSKE